MGGGALWRKYGIFTGGGSSKLNYSTVLVIGGGKGEGEGEKEAKMNFYHGSWRWKFGKFFKIF